MGKINREHKSMKRKELKAIRKEFSAFIRGGIYKLPKDSIYTIGEILNAFDKLQSEMSCRQWGR